MKSRVLKPFGKFRIGDIAELPKVDTRRLTAIRFVEPLEEDEKPKARTKRAYRRRDMTAEQPE